MADPKKLRAEANALVAELLDRLAHADVHELEVKRGGLRVRVSRDDGSVHTARPSSRQAGASPTAPGTPSGPSQASTGAELPTVNAPLTGIFYRAASPQVPPYVQVGSAVGVGEVIGLIEAMKLFNEIRATVAGTVRRIFVENGQLVRARQPLIELEP